MSPGRTAIVTGGSRGIGAAIVRELAGDGVAVAAIARTAEPLERLQRELAQAGSAPVVPLVADLRDGAALEAAIATARAELGGVDVLVNNAGSTPFGSFGQLDDAAWQGGFETKLLGYVRCIRQVLPGMRAQGSGRIVNVVGMGGRFATPSYVLGAYNAALLHLTRSLATELAADGISVHAVNPGPTDTERMREALAEQAAERGLDPAAHTAQFLATLPLGRLIEPEEVARVVAMLCSGVYDLGSGSALQVDGGAVPGVF